MHASGQAIVTVATTIASIFSRIPRQLDRNRSRAAPPTTVDSNIVAIFTIFLPNYSDKLLPQR